MRWRGHDMIQLLKISVIVVVSLANASLGVAASASPVGLWKTIDDATGEVKSVVRISEENGSLVGTIVKLFPKPGKDPNPLCDKCTDEKKDQPLLGMGILWGLTKDGEEWSGGLILDPDNGKTYKSKIKLEGAGGTLTVRGYIGFSLLGRSQTWVRTESMETK
jgi:uncharacterized protein (DUF2147 family)